MAQTFVCLRYFLIGGAIIVGVCGIIQSICAGYFIYQLYEYSPLTPSNVCGSSITLLVMGLITCMIAWCIWQFLNFMHRSQVIIFVLALIIVAGINASAGIWALVRHEQVDLLPMAHLEKVFGSAISDDTHLWNRMYSKLHCCGINGPIDYHNHGALPWSCCDNETLLQNSNENKGVCTTIYSRGCQHIVLNRTRSILLHIFLLALCTVLLQVCFIICLTCYMRAYRERMGKRKELMIAAQTYMQTCKDIGANNNLLGQ
ncbi:uroplakin-1b [Ptiloglossa arizonensis]|uniref:uroplakin-1b n=1 Tax=Ptiloglossa arizonensis TaxID=3350558 RepID=UPI003FA127F5